MGKKPITLKYSYSEHSKVTKWLQEHANLNINTSITGIDDTDSIKNSIQFDDEGNISLRVPIDDVIYQKYLK